MARRSRFQGSQNLNSRSYREPAKPALNYGDDYRNLREILGAKRGSGGMRTADFQLSPYRGIDARDVADYENLKNQYRDAYGKDYSEVGGSTSQSKGFADRFPVAESPIDRFRRERGEGIRGIVPPVGRPVPPRFTGQSEGLHRDYEQPGVNFREALEGKTSQQDKPTVTQEKGKAFGDLLKRMKRF
jgi:hypothetical protein